MASVNLLSTSSYVSTPFVKVKIGDYTFGAYSKSSSYGYDEFGTYKMNRIRFPNYIQSLTVKKVNGTVNTYTLVMKYQITESDDPNFLDKVFSSVSDTRAISFSYGDMSAPSYVFRDEEALITKVRQRSDVSNASITYTITAVSKGSVALAGSLSFPARQAKPSDVIKELLYSPKYGLTEVFYGMTNKGLVEQNGLIASDDKSVNIQAKQSISAIDYLSYLVSCMEPQMPTDTLSRNKVYLLTYHDDTSGVYGGPYFKVSFMEKGEDNSTAYAIDIGYPSQNAVVSFEIEDDETYAIYYKFQSSLADGEYVQRINDRGEIVEEYAPLLASGTANRIANADARTWWSQVTQYPIKSTLKIRGLLRPAVLMSYVRLNAYFYGRKWNAGCGLWIVTSQTDVVDFNGYSTTLSLTRVGGDSESKGVVS